MVIMYTSDVPTDKIMAAKASSLLTEHYDSSLALLISATSSLVAILHKSSFIIAVLQFFIANAIDFNVPCSTVM